MPRFSRAKFDPLNTNEMQNRLFDLIVHFHLTIRSEILIRHRLRPNVNAKKVRIDIQTRRNCERFAEALYRTT